MKYINDKILYIKARALDLLYDKLHNEEQSINMDDIINDVQKIIRKEYNINIIVKHNQGKFDIIFY